MFQFSSLETGQQLEIGNLGFLEDDISSNLSGAEPERMKSLVTPRGEFHGYRRA